MPTIFVHDGFLRCCADEEDDDDDDDDDDGIIEACPVFFAR